MQEMQQQLVGLAVHTPFQESAVGSAVGLEDQRGIALLLISRHDPWRMTYCIYQLIQHTTVRQPANAPSNIHTRINAIGKGGEDNQPDGVPSQQHYQGNGEE